MKTAYQAALVLSVLALLRNPVMAQDAGAAFVLLPVETELHKHLLPADTAVYVVLNGDANVIADIANAVPTIDLAAQNKILFRIRVTAEGREAKDRFVTEESQGLAELVGFKFSAIHARYE